jgi:hypothetical protein
MVNGITMKMGRVMADSRAIDQLCANVRPLIVSLRRAFILSMDELGFADAADLTREIVVVPSDFADDRIRMPFDRSPQRATVVAGIAADGTSLKLLIVLDQSCAVDTGTRYL